MVIIGCDFHPRFQQVAFVEQETGEYGERRLLHPEEAERFYRGLAGKQVVVGVEATGSLRWFRRLLAELGQEFVLGDAAQIRAACVRRQQTDKRDARHILQLLLENRFPRVWQRTVAEEELRQLLVHRCRMVRLRTRVHNQLDAIAKGEGKLAARGKKGLAELAGLPLGGWYAVERQDLLELLQVVERRVGALDEAVGTAAGQNQAAALLMTHPGVGPVVSLAFVLAIGDWRRFPRGRKVASYLGLIPVEESSGQSRRLGHVSKQGNSMVRWLLVQAAMLAQRHDASWHRQYVRLSMTKHHGVAKLAIAHKLAVRLYWMLRSGEDYSQVVERGSHAGQSGYRRG
jgi:transposase